MMSAKTSEAYQIFINDPSLDHNSPHLLDNLVLTTVTKPKPGPGEALVRICAVSLNYRDLLVLANAPLYPLDTAPGLTPCCDGAGEIESVGPNSRWATSIGEGVILRANDTWEDGPDAGKYVFVRGLGAGDMDGTLRQYMVVKDDQLLKKPKNLDFKEAAALVGAGGTAMNVLESVVGLGKGTTVLTQGTGGVSSLVIQLAASLGARVISTSSSDEKLQVAKSLGATDLVNYASNPNWSEEVLRLTNGKGVDLVADVAGGTIGQSLKSVRDGGIVCMIGFLSKLEPTEVVFELISKAKTLKGIRGNSKATLQHTIDLVEKHDLHPLLGKVFDWADAPKAFDTLRKGDFMGKIVISV